MEDSEKLDCEKSLNIPKESTNLDDASKQELLSDNDNIESHVSKITLLTENPDSDLKTNETESTILTKSISEEIEPSSKPTFKKPALFIGPRKGKPFSRKAINPNNPPNSSKSEDSELKNEFRSCPNETQKQENKTDEQVDKNTDNQLNKSNKNHEDEKSENQLNKGDEKLIGKELKAEKERKIIDKERKMPLLYKEPSWSGKPEKKYKAEVLKSGLILETIDLSEKNFHVIGRLPMCDIALAHPTVSRYHAVFQYRREPDENNEKGLYVYDFGSTHGTFWNGNRIRPNIYVRIRGGHMIRFGNSQRKFIMQTPPEEEEEESELTVTELKEKKRLEMEERTLKELERKKEEEEAERLRIEKEANDGINWGMSEDADEETDLKENPFAQTNNEELFLDDPKKTLRGWFEREGHELQYQAEENGIGRFTCWVDLPLDDHVGRTVRAEACVKGKKKEAVIQCALEACRILDRHGLLRQAVHEGRKKKARNWEEEDFYDSDEDNFLDRTGTVEKKREQRMRNAGKLNAKAETYSSLTEKHSTIVKQIEDIENRLKESQNIQNADANSSVDALDAFMSHLKNATILNKSETTKLKMDLQKLHKEEEQLLKLIEISRPANLPALRPQISSDETPSTKRKSINDSPKLEKKMKTSNIPQSNDEQDTKKDEKIDKEGNYSNREIEFLDDKYSKKSDNEMLKEKDMMRKTSGSGDDEKVISNRTEENNACDENLEDDEGNKEVSIEKIEDEEVLRKKRRNMKRIHKRALKAEKEKIKSYENEEYQEDYCTWVPPQGQSGDGKTSLNERFGY